MAIYRNGKFNPDDPATAAAVSEKASHGGRKIGVNLLTFLLVPSKRQIRAEDFGEVRCILHGDRDMKRARGGKPDKDGNIHSR
jgi:hypothetical protein